jgi:O-methyltransferase
MFLARLMDKLQNCKAKKLHLFDSFEGMPDTDASKDIHQSGNFSDTSLEAVRKRVESVISDKSMVEYHKGFIPASFQGVETGKLSFCHIDLDLHRAIADACEYAYPKLQTGGFILFDDYGFPSCPGAREAVDDFFADKPEVPLVLQTGQAIVFCGS